MEILFCCIILAIHYYYVGNVLDGVNIEVLCNTIIEKSEGPWGVAGLGSFMLRHYFVLYAEKVYALNLMHTNK